MTLGEFFEKRGVYSSRRAPNQQVIHSFDKLMVVIARSHIMGENTVEGYTPKPSNAGNIKDAQELRFEDSRRIATG